MTYFCAGSYSRIVSRLQKDGRCCEVVPLHIHTIPSCNDTPGWCPRPLEEFFPICPVVGDTFLMEGYYNGGAGEESKPEKKWWRVVSRSLAISGPSAMTMHGIVELFVEVVDGPFLQLNDEEAS